MSHLLRALFDLRDGEPLLSASVEYWKLAQSLKLGVHRCLRYIVLETVLTVSEFTALAAKEFQSFNCPQGKNNFYIY